MALTRTLTLYSGSDSLPVVDYTDATDWPNTELAGMANNGEAAASSWTLRDDDGVIPDYVAPGKFINSHNVVTATVGSNLLFRGRVAAQEHFRGRQKAGRAAEWSVTLEDQNSHLRGMVVDGWIRPAETDAARMQALVAGYLSGNYRTTTNLNGSNYIVTGSNTIALPAKTYTGVTPSDIAQELAGNADKEVFVTIDNELAYFGHDYTGYASLLRISDDIADANATTYAPWNPRGSEAGREQLSALRVYYQPGDGRTTQASTRVTNNLASSADFWEEVYWDSTSTTSAQAIARAQKTLDYRAQPETTYSCSIGPMSGDEIWKVKPGQTIQFKSRGARGGRNADGSFAGDSFQTVRVRDLNWTMPAEDQYIAHLELERPKRIHAPSAGSQALTIMPTPAPVASGDAVVNPTELYRWSYTNAYPAGGTKGNRDDTNTYGGGPERHYAGTSGRQLLGLSDPHWDPPDAAFGTAYGKKGPAVAQSDYIPASQLTDYYLSGDFMWDYGGTGKDVRVTFHGAAPTYNQIGADHTLITGAGHANLIKYAITAVYTTPVGTQFTRTTFTGGTRVFVDNMTTGTPGSSAIAANDPYALPDPGSSPYYARTDDPRFDFVPDDTLPNATEAVLANNSGLDIAYGDIVTLDSSADDAFTVNTILNNNTGWLGVAQEPIGSNTSGRVLLSGYTAIVNVGSNSTTRGSWLYGSNMARRAYGSNVRAAGAFGQVLTTSVAPDAIIWTQADAASPGTLGYSGTGLVGTLNLVVDGGGAVISTGNKGDAVIDFACHITGWSLLADTSATLTLDTWKDTYANYPPTVADTMWGTKPALSGATKNQASGLSIPYAAGATIRVNVDSNDNATRLVLALTFTRD